MFVKKMLKSLRRLKTAAVSPDNHFYCRNVDLNFSLYFYFDFESSKCTLNNWNIFIFLIRSNKNFFFLIAWPTNCRYRWIGPTYFYKTFPTKSKTVKTVWNRLFLNGIKIILNSFIDRETRSNRKNPRLNSLFLEHERKVMKFSSVHLLNTYTKYKQSV